MNNKGFTLIEIIAVVLILGIIFLVSYPTLENILKKSEKEEIKLNEESIITAAKTYFNLHNKEYDFKVGNNINVSINKLIEEDLIDIDINNQVFNTVNCEIQINNKLNCKLIKNNIYKIGDKVTYNGMDFYVIANSDENSDYVTLLKAEPLTVEEVNIYGVGHVNRYTYSQGTAYDLKGYGSMAYYSSENCGYPEGNSGSYVETDCTTDYALSDIKYVVDEWTKDKIKSNDLKKDNLGYKARLITFDELIKNLGYEEIDGQMVPSANGKTPNWIYNSEYYYWTMSQYNNSVWIIASSGTIKNNHSVFNYYGLVRPVINILKSTI